MGLLPMGIDILPPYDDRIFKAMLTAPEAKPALLLLASAIIERPVIDVLVRNNELPISDTDEKAEQLDINCLIDDDSQADIEMQANRMDEETGSNHDNLKARSIYNLCDLHSSQSSKGKSYNTLVRSYQVMFCGFTVFPDRTAYMNSYSMRHDIDNELLKNAIRVIFVELTKLNDTLKKPVEDMTDMEKFSIFLRYAENPDYRKIVNKVIESKEGLSVAGEVLMNISNDEREKAIFRSRRIAMADRESNRITAERNLKIAMAESEKRGVEVGEKRGEKSKANEMAKIMIIDGEKNEKIMRYTGLTLTEIEALRNSI